MGIVSVVAQLNDESVFLAGICSYHILRHSLALFVDFAVVIRRLLYSECVSE